MAAIFYQIFIFNQRIALQKLCNKKKKKIADTSFKNCPTKKIFKLGIMKIKNVTIPRLICYFSITKISFRMCRSMVIEGVQSDGVRRVQAIFMKVIFKHEFTIVDFPCQGFQKYLIAYTHVLSVFNNTLVEGNFLTSNVVVIYVFLKLEKTKDFFPKRSQQVLVKKIILTLP